MSEAGKSPISTSQWLEQVGRSNTAGRGRRQERASHGGGGRSLGNLLATLMLVPLLALVLWLALEQRQLREQLLGLDADNSVLRQTMAEQDARMTAMADALGEQIRTRVEALNLQATLDDELLSRLQSQVTRDVEQLSTMVAGLQRQIASGQGRDIQLRYTEVDFLLRLAQRRLSHEGDVASARQMLMEADGLLADIDSTLGNRLRQMLEGDMARLAEVSAVDFQWLQQALDALVAQVDGLAVLPSRVAGYEAGVAAGGQTLLLDEDDVGAAAMALLRSVFVWRRPDQQQLPALLPQQELVVRQNLRLLLEQARLALIMRDEDLLQDTLQRSLLWLELHYHADAPGVVAVREGLEQLATTSLRPALPDLGESLALARQLSGVAGL